MKKLLYIILAACIGFTACNFEISDNGDLDGYWQLYQVDSLKKGTSVDKRTSGLFWSVQVNLLEIRNNVSPDSSIFFRFDKSGDILRIWAPIANIRAISDSIIKDSARLSAYYLHSTVRPDSTLESVLHINELNSDRMVLENSSYRLHFRKY